MEIRQVVTDKTFFRKERDDTYSNYLEATPRELFQNSIDAGAGTISIEIAEAMNRGSVFRPAVADTPVVRLVFEDDGTGMDEDVIDNVFFRPGQSTKDYGGSGTIGGFGRARLATHLANVRYAIVTNGRAVEGDGAEYVHLSVPEMIDGLRTKLSDAPPAGAADHPSRHTREAIERDIERLEAQVDRPSSGCRMEIDFDPSDRVRSIQPTAEAVRKSFVDYLQRSAVRARVVMDGVPFEGGLAFRRPTRILSIDDSDTGATIPFAKVYYREKDKARFKNRVIVRVAGAMMYEQYLESPVQVVVEIEPALSRSALVASRDALKGDYKKALDSFLQEIILDTRSALDGKQNTITLLEGQKGRRSVAAPVADVSSIKLSFQPEEKLERDGPRRSQPALSDVQMRGHAGVDYATLARFMASVREGTSFLDKSDLWSVAHAVRDAVGYSGPIGPSKVVAGLEALGSYHGRVMEALRVEVERIARAAAAEEELRRASRLRGMSDIAVQTTGIVRGRIADAMRRNHPSKWDPSTGNGARLKATMAVWIAYVEEALSVAMRAYPSRFEGDFSWTPGLVYSATEETWTAAGTTASGVNAMLVEDEKLGCVISFNPVDSNGNLRLNPSDPMDRKWLEARATHEVSHVIEKWHDQDFASVFTDLIAGFDVRRANRIANLEIEAIRQEYARGRVRRASSHTVEIGSSRPPVVDPESEDWLPEDDVRIDRERSEDAPAIPCYGP